MKPNAPILKFTPTTIMSVFRTSPYTSATRNSVLPLENVPPWKSTRTGSCECAGWEILVKVSEWGHLAYICVWDATWWTPQKNGQIVRFWSFFCVFGVVPELETTLETQNSGFLLSRVAIAWITVKLWIPPKLTKLDFFTENSGFSLSKLNFSTDFVKNPCRRS